MGTAQANIISSIIACALFLMMSHQSLMSIFLTKEIDYTGNGSPDLTPSVKNFRIYH